MAAAGGDHDVGNDALETLEIGCLSVQVVGARNIRSGAGYVDMFLDPQLSPYCKISLGVRCLAVTCYNNTVVHRG